MTREMFLPASSLPRLVTTLLSAGTRVYGPSMVGGRPQYRRVQDAGELDLQAPMPALPLKALFLPPSEPLFSWRRNHHDVTLTPIGTAIEPAIVLGARPCDAAAIEVLDKVMGWDYRDELWFGRREATTIIALGCPMVDESCFCTAVDQDPTTTQGADILIIPLEGSYHVQVVSAKGEALVAKYAKLFSDGGAEAQAEAFRKAARERVEKNLSISTKDVRAWLDTHFEDELWHELSWRCHGCGACAAVCPTCHCFDIVDEKEGMSEGTRRRNWDTCQAGKFTLHASGHNPRGEQCNRCRQRLSHKFHIYPERFGVLLCTGCGRCVRACPGGMVLPEVLRKIYEKAQQAPVPVTEGGGQ